jgi:tripartite-type tricarboxylate transporter receptor subunit TctC
VLSVKFHALSEHGVSRNTQNSTRITFLPGVVAFACTAVMPGVAPYATAQSFPVKPIRMLVPVPPGGGADFVARSYASRLGEALGQQLVVDNRGGAAGIIAMEAAAKAAPDGYTIIQTNVSTISINPYMYARLPYDAERGFAPISLCTLNPLVLVVHPSLAAKSVPELMSLAKVKPGAVTYASLGSGSIQHLAGFMFAKAAGIAMVHVPYKGAAPATVDLLAGQVHTAFSGIGTVVSHVRAGRLRGLATTGLKRVEAYADLPTMSESGGPAMQIELWNGFLAPAGTPTPIVKRLADEINRIARVSDLPQVLATQGTTPTTNTPEEFARFIRAEQARFARLVKETGIRLD